MANQSPLPKQDPKPEYDAAHVPMTEEFDSAKWTLPPIVPVAIALVVVAIVIGAFTWGTRYKPVTAGSVRQVYAVEVPNQNSVLVAVQVEVSNIGREKPIFVHGASADLTTADGKQFHDIAAAAVDYQRYFQAFPDLQQHSTAALALNNKVPVNGQESGTVIFGFPVDKNTFDQRKSLEVTVEIYDQKPLKLVAK